MAETAASTSRSGTDVVLEIDIAAAPETVFEFFTDPAKMVAWKGVEAELDPTPGGTYRVTVIPTAIAAGEYVEVEPPHRVVFTWGWEGGEAVPPGSSTVEVTLSPTDSGTHLTLVHKDLPDDEQRTEHTEGWRHYCGRLRVAAAGGDPGLDPWMEGKPS